MNKDHARWIKISLVKNNLTQRDIARDLHFTDGYVCMLIKGKRKNKIFDEWIATHLGTPPEGI